MSDAWQVGGCTARAHQRIPRVDAQAVAVAEPRREVRHVGAGGHVDEPDLLLPPGLGRADWQYDAPHLLGAQPVDVVRVPGCGVVHDVRAPALPVTESARAHIVTFEVRRYKNMLILAVNAFTVNVLAVNCSLRPPPVDSLKSVLTL